jgi:hypothetical protein
LPPVVIRHSIRSGARFTLNPRDVEELLAERGPDVPYESVHPSFRLQPRLMGQRPRGAPNDVDFARPERSSALGRHGKEGSQDRWQTTTIGRHWW